MASGWWWRDAVALLLWPGLLGGTLLGWLYMWLARKLTARVQGRQGPPFYQPFWDFIKLLGKQVLVPVGVRRILFYGLPLIAVISTASALALVPAPGSAMDSFAGDLIVFVYLLEVPALVDVLAGYGSRSPYGQVGAAREALLSLAYNLPFLAAVMALAVQARTFNLLALVQAPFGPVHVAAGIAFLLAIPARLKSNPFSIPNAEQELVAGAHTEYNGAPLALFELAHALEFAALVGMFAALFLPRVGIAVVDLLIYLAVSLLLAALVAFLAAATARLKVQQAFRFYWSWGALAAALAFVAAAIW